MVSVRRGGQEPQTRATLPVTTKSASYKEGLGRRLRVFVTADSPTVVPPGQKAGSRRPGSHGRCVSPRPWSGTFPTDTGVFESVQEILVRPTGLRFGLSTGEVGLRTQGPP